MSKVYDDPTMSSFNAYLAMYKRNAANRGYEFLLTTEQFRELTKLPCVYCGSPPANKYLHTKKCRSPYVCNGVDRLDNKLGYTVENSAPCCRRCNYLKQDHSYSDFVSAIVSIYNHVKRVL